MSPATGSRRLDWIALALVAAGALLFVVAQIGMGDIVAGGAAAPDPTALPFQTIARWQRLRTLAFIGGGLVALGVAVGIVSFVRFRRGATTDPTPAE